MHCDPESEPLEPEAGLDPEVAQAGDDDTLGDAGRTKGSGWISPDTIP
jgi:hypothetical protein